MDYKNEIIKILKDSKNSSSIKRQEAVLNFLCENDANVSSEDLTKTIKSISNTNEVLGYAQDASIGAMQYLILKATGVNELDLQNEQKRAELLQDENEKLGLDLKLAEYAIAKTEEDKAAILEQCEIIVANAAKKDAVSSQKISEYAAMNETQAQELERTKSQLKSNKVVRWVLTATTVVAIGAVVLFGVLFGKAKADNKKLGSDLNDKTKQAEAYQGEIKSLNDNIKTKDGTIVTLTNEKEAAEADKKAAQDAQAQAEADKKTAQDALEEYANKLSSDNQTNESGNNETPTPVADNDNEGKQQSGSSSGAGHGIPGSYEEDTDTNTNSSTGNQNQNDQDQERGMGWL